MANSEIEVQDVNEDTVQCLFFPLESQFIDWELLCVEINTFIDIICDGYLWHHDEFKVYFPLINQDENDVPHHLASTTYFGDNIEDEWFIVYILFEITKKFNIIVQVKDADGNFLLIEAADHLPPWAKPDTTNNRVFIYDNHIHIIPPELNGNPVLHLRDAIKIVAECKERTKTSNDILAAIRKRIENYPEKIKDTLHSAVVNIPIDIATLLTLRPTFISTIVNAYCAHDMIDAKACQKMDFQNCILVKIKFSKFMYAMLMHSKPIQSIKYSSILENDKSSLLGFKLSCGYHIIMNKSVSDIFSTKEYNKFINNLKENGYFKENIEASKEYTALLEKAKMFYSNIESPINSSFCNEVLGMISTQEFKNVKQTLINRQESDIKEDSDDWLNIQPDQLNDFLNKQYGRSKATANMTEQTITTKLSNFLNLTSDFEGIEITDETEHIDFDPDDFKNALDKMLKVISELDVDNKSESSDDIDYDNELLENLGNTENNNLHEKKLSILQNMVQSMKEEEGSTGPSSNLLRSIGIHKSDILDSDDDE